ncbi:MAG: SLC13 family permease [Gammaproteobacteria bacterium]|nr:SLC13 family permease [Gammaproteobacteria bacterium]MCF6230657.1 SLC13 family permease [Gammaproteobacteria bacterium]
MGWEAWFTLAIIGGCFSALLLSRVSADVIIVGGLMILLLVGILTPQEALSGMANEGMATVALLFIVAAGLKDTGAIGWLSQAMLGRPKSIIVAQLRLMAPVMAMSAVLNNTPVVAMLIPAVNDWAKRQQFSVSKLMMPLSYAAIVGGTMTLIGTSTNLIVNGLYIEQSGTSGLGMWELAYLGLPAALIVLLYTLFTSKWLLKERLPAISQFDNMREYTIEMEITPAGPLAGKTIEQAGLRQLPGLFLSAIERDGDLIPAVSPRTQLLSSDILIFAGVVDSVVDLQKIRGLQTPTEQHEELNSQRHARTMVEVVVSNSCPLLGQTIREGKFRAHYNAAIIAVARNGEHLNQKIGDIKLSAGDTLLLEASPYFIERQRNSRDFYLVSTLAGAKRPNHDKAALAMAIMVGMIAAVTIGWLSMFKAAFLAAGVMILTRCITPGSARRSVDWQVLIVIAASIGIGAALTKSGAASAIAHQLVTTAGAEPMLALALIYLMTVLCTEMITNNAAAVLMFPIALMTAQQLDVSMMPFIIAIMFAASCSFATPIGYQTNLMVYGPGGYHFSDYLRFGLPITLILSGVALTIIPIVWPF